MANLDNARHVAFAVADKEGEVVFCDSNESSVSHINPDAPHYKANESTVSVTTVDSFIKSTDLHPSAVKIDIEGYDILALIGATETAKTHHPVFLVEYNQEEERPNTWQALQKFNEETGYLIYAVTRSDRGHFDYKYSFRKFTTSEISSMDPKTFKMLFLVSVMDQEWFANFSATQGTWKGEHLRPKQIRTLMFK